MKLCDLAPGYLHAAALLKIGIEDAEEELERTDDPVDRMMLMNKIRIYKQAHRECRAIGNLCRNYYTKPRNRRFTFRSEYD